MYDRGKTILISGADVHRWNKKLIRKRRRILSWTKEQVRKRFQKLLEKAEVKNVQETFTWPLLIRWPPVNKKHQFIRIMMIYKAVDDPIQMELGIMHEKIRQRLIKEDIIPYNYYPKEN